MIYDYCVVGGGIVGMATAMKLLEKRPGASVLILEKESSLAHHQTGHNSGVIHSGIYYEPGTLKAELCRRGARLTKEFCVEHGIPVQTCGKLLVATNPQELTRMGALAERAKINQIDVEPVDASSLRALEPNVSGRGALLIPATGIVNYAHVTNAMASVVQAAGGRVELGVEVSAIHEGSSLVIVSAGERRWEARYLVACAGLQADRVARLAGLPANFQIVPFRGKYYRLPDSLSSIVSHLIYPIPDPNLPFLGVHLTLTIKGGVTVGPNAVLSLSREGYRPRSVNARDVKEYAAFLGMWRFARKYYRTGAVEAVNSLSKRSYLKQCTKFCPSLEVADLLPHESGIRAQAVLRDGTLVHNFLFEETDRMVHVCNAPSPAATSAIPIGEYIVDRLIGRQTAA